MATNEKALPAFLFHAQDWLTSTAGLSAEAKGCYIDLLAYAWVKDGLPTDLDEVRRIGGLERGAWRRVWPKLEARWPKQDGRLKNPRQEQTRAELIAKLQKVAEAGQKGGRASAATRRKSSTATPKYEAPLEASVEAPLQASPPAEVVAGGQATGKQNPTIEIVTTNSLTSPDGSVSETRAPARGEVVPFDPSDPGPSPARRRRPHAAWEGVGLYVAQQQHQDFVGRLELGGITTVAADAALRAWYRDVENEVRQHGVIVGENMFRFWDVRFATWQGESATPQAARTHAAARRSIERLRERRGGVQ